MLNRSEFTKRKEESSIHSIVKHLGIASEDIMIDESPDVIIKNYEGKIIGLENTEYHSKKRIAETDSRLWKICKEYAQILMNRGEGGFQINVFFSDEVYSLKKINSETIIEELEYCRSNKIRKEHGRKYIQSIFYMWYLPKDKVVVAPIKAKIVETNLDYSIVKSLVDKKERKLQDYKLLEKNESIDEYWLNIYIPFREFTMYNQDDTFTVESSYDRIYLTTSDSIDIPLRIK